MFVRMLDSDRLTQFLIVAMKEGKFMRSTNKYMK